MALSNEEIDENQLHEDPPNILLSWDFPDRPTYQRGRLWYIVALIVGLSLLVYAIFTANFLFALLVLLFALVVYLNISAPPRQSSIYITEDGIVIGRQSYPFKNIQSFWFIYEPPTVKKLYLKTQSLLDAEIGVELEDINPNEVRTLLTKYVVEDLDKKDESLSEILSRLLKI